MPIWVEQTLDIKIKCPACGEVIRGITEKFECQYCGAMIYVKITAVGGR